MSSQQWAFGASALVHALAAAAFALYAYTGRKTPLERSVLVSAFIVATVTATVTAAQVSLPDVHVNYVLTWCSYTVSLFLIGKSLAAAVYQSSDYLVPAYLLAIVGLGGVLGLAVPGNSWAFWIVALGTTLLYAAFALLLLAARKRGPGTTRLIVVFLAATLLYIVPYVAGYARTRAVDSVALEQWLFLAGNVVTKIAVPFWEVRLLHAARVPLVK